MYLKQGIARSAHASGRKSPLFWACKASVLKQNGAERYNHKLIWAWCLNILGSLETRHDMFHFHSDSISKHTTQKIKMLNDHLDTFSLLRIRTLTCLQNAFFKTVHFKRKRCVLRMWCYSSHDLRFGSTSPSSNGTCMIDSVRIRFQNTRHKKSKCWMTIGTHFHSFNDLQLHIDRMRFLKRCILNANGAFQEIQS